MIVITQERASRRPAITSIPLGLSLTPTPLKLQKPDSIKFSGGLRDIASFKENFESIVVLNRSAVDIGLCLKCISLHSKIIFNFFSFVK